MIDGMKMSLTSKLNLKPTYECWTIQEAVWKLQQSCQFTDLVLSCSDGTVPAHKVIMAGVFKLLGIVDQEHECVILPGVEVAEVEEAVEDLYLKSESEKLMKIFSCRSIKTENLDASLIVEVKPEVPSEEECLSYEDEMIIQKLTKFDEQSEKEIPSNTLQTNKKHRLKHNERITSIKRLQKHVT